MKHIKQLSVIIGLILFIIPLSARAQSRFKKVTIEKLEDVFSTAFGLDTLETLDAKYPHHGRMKVVIEYTSIEPEIKVFKTFGGVGRCLRSMETDSMPTETGLNIKLPMRLVMPLVGCKRGLCTYDFNGGILHNRLYIKKISYAYRNKRPYIKTIFLLAG